MLGSGARSQSNDSRNAFPCERQHRVHQFLLSFHQIRTGRYSARESVQHERMLKSHRSACRARCHSVLRNRREAATKLTRLAPCRLRRRTLSSTLAPKSHEPGRSRLCRKCEGASAAPEHRQEKQRLPWEIFAFATAAILHLMQIG